MVDKMIAAFEITDRFPLPEERHITGRQGRKSDGRQDAIARMQPGFSFLLKASMSSASVLCWWAKAKFPERDFTARRERTGVRIWRRK